jgi:hypothetical protein
MEFIPALVILSSDDFFFWLFFGFSFVLVFVPAYDTWVIGVNQSSVYRC